MVYGDNGTGMETLVRYVSEEGEKIKVISGVCRGNEWSDEDFSLRVYVDGKLVERYLNSDLKVEDIPLLRKRLEEFVLRKEDSEELLIEISQYSAHLRDMRMGKEAELLDEGIRYDAFERDEEGNPVYEGYDIYLRSCRRWQY